MTVKPDSEKLSPEAALRSFIDRFDPKYQKLIRSIRAAVRKRFPTANELAYDYSNSVVISYSPTERGLEGIVSIAARDDGVRLYVQGVGLPDPKGLLQGAAKQVRYVEIEAVSRLAHPDVEALIAAAIDQSKTPLPSEGGGKLIIRSDGTKAKARRKPSK